MKFKNILTKEFLQQKYLKERLSTYQIAKLVGCSAMTVYCYLKKFGIPIRTISEANRLREISEATRRKISESLKGKSNPFKGKHQSEEAKRKISEAKKCENNPMYGVHRFGKEAPNWKGGIAIDKDGYILKYCPNHPYANNHGYVRKHRLIVEQYLGRYLNPEEVVHHIDGNKQNNNITNLMVFSNNLAHIRFHKDPNNVKESEIIFNGRKNKKGGTKNED